MKDQSFGRYIKKRYRRHEMFGEVRYHIILEGLICGILAGIVVSAFRLVLGQADSIRAYFLSGSMKAGLIGLTFLIVSAVIVSILVVKQPYISGSGIPQARAELMGKIETCWWKIILAKFIGGFLSITSGLSLGREGPSIQLGTMVGKGLSQINEKIKKDEKRLMICGAGAGLAAAFSAPIAGAIFTMEEMEKKYTTEGLLSVLAATIAADWVAGTVFGLKPVFTLYTITSLTLSKYWLIIILGILLGLFGSIYNKCIEISQDFFAKLKPKWLKAVIPAVSIIILAFIYPSVLGSGHELVGIAGEGTLSIKALAVLLIVKFLFSVFSFGTGAPGGIFLPLLVMGAVSGGLFGKIATSMFDVGAIYIPLFVVLGMSGLFSAIVRSPLTGIILISEMVGALTNMLPLVVVSFISYMVAEFLYSHPIYDQLLDRLLKNSAKDEENNTFRHMRSR